MDTPNGQESKLRKIMFNEVSFLIAVIAASFSIFMWISNPQRNVELQVVKLQAQVEANETVASKIQNLKDNDLHTLSLKMDNVETRQIEILKAIARLEALISKR